MHKYQARKLSIKQWSEADRPREKLLLQGKKNLSDAELVAILLGSGSRERSALALAQHLLKHYEGDLRQLARAGTRDLCRFPGIGPAKAVTLQAALELGHRRLDRHPRRPVTIRSSRDAYSVLAARIADLNHEEFWILHLNRANRIIGKEQISTGGVSGTVVDTKIIFHKALQQLSSSLILAHNHPSGNLKPSQADLDLTKKLREAGKLLDIQILDHLILSEHGYFSFADEQLL